jgi:ankyrin repeat protein
VAIFRFYESDTSKDAANYTKRCTNHKLTNSHCYSGDRVETVLLRGAEDKPAKKTQEATFASELKEELVQAIIHGNVDRIRKLQADNKGIINAKDKEDKPMLLVAIEANQKASFDCMIELGVNIDGKDKHGFTGLHKAAMQRRTEMGDQTYSPEGLSVKRQQR